MKARFAAGEAAATWPRRGDPRRARSSVVVLIVPLVAVARRFRALEPLGGLNETVALPRAGPTATSCPTPTPRWR